MYNSLACGVGALWFPAVLVLPMYVAQDLPRNHPRTVWTRIAITTLTSCSLSWLPVYLVVRSKRLPARIVPKLLGLRPEGLGAAAASSALLTMLLFLGPATSLALQRGRPSLRSRLDLPPRLLLRNLLVAPLLEELVFRGGALAYLRLLGAGRLLAVLGSTALFAAAHLHHLRDLLKHQRLPLGGAASMVAAQFAYTSLFGGYAALLQLRAGNLAAPVVAHVICNFLGLPEPAPERPHWARRVVAAAYVAGLSGFAAALARLPPAWFRSH